MSLGRSLARPSLGTILGACALFVALGGPAAAEDIGHAAALAAGSVTGRQVKDGTIQSRDLSRAVRAQLKRAAVAGPAGAPGAAGPAGPAGAAGPKGDPGAPAALADGSVTTAKLADGAVTGAKVADGTIAVADLGFEVVSQSFSGPSLGAGQSYSDTALCPTGKVAIGGSASSTDSKTVLYGSGKIPNLRAFAGAIRNTTAASVPYGMTIQAFCVNA